MKEFSFTAVTTTDIETAYLAVSPVEPLTYNYAIGVNVIPALVSGTSTIAATLQASNDNISWFDITSAVNIVNAGVLIPFGWDKSSAPFKYYRVKLESSGTGVINLTGGIIIK